MVFVTLIVKILLLISFLPKYKAKFLEIKSLKSENYFVVFDNGFFIYDCNFSLIKSLFNFTSKIIDSDNIIITKHINKEIIYIFCLIKDYLYIYNDYMGKIIQHDINSYVEDKELLKYKYYIFIPYNTIEGNLNLIISSIKEKIERKYYRRRYYDEYYYYNIYLDYNINNENDGKLELKMQGIHSFDATYKLFIEKNICHILDSSFIIKCIYYDNIYWNNIKYDIKNNKYDISGPFAYRKITFDQIVSSKSFENNYLVCALNNYGDYFQYYNFTDCALCDENRDYDDECDYIDYLKEYDCSEIKTYYFNEVDKFVLICKKFKEFIIFIIDYDLRQVDDEKIIYIICDDNKGYEGKFSLIYNNLTRDYELITDYNFTENSDCYFYQNETNIRNNNKTKNMTHMEIRDKEIVVENTNLFYNYSFNLTFSDFMESEIFDNSNNFMFTDAKEDIIVIEKKETNLTKEEVINNISAIMSDKEIGKTYEIKGDDFTIIIKPTNSPRLPNTTHVEFDVCEQIIRKEYNISNESIITFFQMEIDNENDNALYNQIKYTIYDDELKEIDLSLCNDIDTQIHYAIKDNTNLDLKSVSNFKNLGVDVLDINDDFFNNLCYAFADGDKDMILEDRIKYIFQNYSLCEEGCSYNSLDIETKSISCDCKIQGNLSTITSPLVFTSDKESSIFDSNIGVSKCYNLVFSFNNKSKNIGFIFFTILIIAYIIFIIIQIKKGIKPICDYLHKEMITHGYLDENAPNFFEYKINEKNKSGIISAFEFKNIKEKYEEEIHEVNDDNKIKNLTKLNKKKGKKKKKKKKSINLKGMDTLIDYQQNIRVENTEDNSDKTSKILKGMKKKKIKAKKIIKDLNDNNNFGIIRIDLNNIKEYFPLDSNQSLHNYSFDEAIKYDRRNIFRVFYIYLLSKQIIFRTFLQRSPLELFYLRFTLFIFMLSCDLALNALFYFNDNISKKYHYAQNLFLFTFSNNITIIIYSTLISSFLLTFLNKLSNSSDAIRNVFRKEEEKIKTNKKKYEIKEETKRQILKDVENILKKFKIKILILLIIQTVLILFFWYFVTAFCHVYSSTQASWLLDSFLSILSRLMLELIFGFLYAKLYQIAIFNLI